MRKSLEEIQSKHTADIEPLQQRLDDAESKKEQAEAQYQKLLERVNTIKSQLGERLKEDAVRCRHIAFPVHALILLFRRNWLLRERKSKSLRMRTALSKRSWIPSPIRCLNYRAIRQRRRKNWLPYGTDRVYPNKTG